MRQGVKQVKLKWRITRADVERMLILVSAALVVALFLSVPYWKGRYFSKSVKKGGARNA